MLYRFIIICLCFSLSPNLGWSHPGHKPKKARPDSLHHDSVATAQIQASTNPAMVQPADADAPMPPPIADMPTAHSAVVHFPLVLLLVAAILQLVALFRPGRGLNWLVAGLALGGFMGAYVAGSFAHPHTTGLSQSAEAVLEHHEQLAAYTTWLAAGALLLKIGTLWRPYRWLETVTTLALVSSVYFVMHTSHMGGELLYRYGVGPRGAYLEQHDHDEAHEQHDEHSH